MPLISSESGGGGSSAPITREQFFSAAQSVNPGGNVRLNWEKSSGSTLLDVTDPTIPLVLTAGVYAVAVSPFCSDGTQAGVYAIVTLALDRGGEDAEVSATFPLIGPATQSPGAAAAVTYYVPAGGEVSAFLFHGAGGALHFRMAAIVQRLS